MPERLAQFMLVFVFFSRLRHAGASYQAAVCILSFTYMWCCCGTYWYVLTGSPLCTSVHASVMACVCDGVRTCALWCVSRIIRGVFSPAPLLTLLRSGSAELTYTCLHHVQLLLTREPTLLEDDFKTFFCR